MKYDDFSSRSYHNYICIITSYDSRQNRAEQSRAEQSSLFRRGLDLYQVKAKRTTITIYIVHVHTIHLTLFCPELFSLGKGEGEGARRGGFWVNVVYMYLYVYIAAAQTGASYVYVCTYVYCMYVRTYNTWGEAEVAFFSMYSTNFKYTGAPGFINNNKLKNNKK